MEEHLIINTFICGFRVQNGPDYYTSYQLVHLRSDGKYFTQDNRGYIKEVSEEVIKKCI